MRNRLILPLILILIPMAGCSNSALQTYYQTQEAFIGTMNASILLRQQNKIDDRTWNNVVIPVVNFVDARLDEMKIAAYEGQNVHETAVQIALQIKRLREINDESGSVSNPVGNGNQDDSKVKRE